MFIFSCWLVVAAIQNVYIPGGLKVENNSFSNIWPKLQKLTSNSGCNKLANQPETKMSKLFFPFIILPPYILNQRFVVGVVKLC